MNWCKALLSKPPSPVSERFGKNEAFATPICAFAATIISSAWRTSGRRSSNSEGKADRNVLGNGLFGKRTSRGEWIGDFRRAETLSTFSCCWICRSKVWDRFGCGVESCSAWLTSSPEFEPWLSRNCVSLRDSCREASVRFEISSSLSSALSWK